MQDKRFSAFAIPTLFTALCTAVLLTACFNTDSGDKDPEPSPTVALASLHAIPLNGIGDTAVTTYAYDAAGMKVRETYDGLLNVSWEWDAQGRYIRRTQHAHRDTVELVTWHAADSSVRGAKNSSLQTAERWFGLKPNCRCGDSLYRYSYSGALWQIHRYAYDAQGNLIRVLRTRVDSALTDTLQRYENTYANGRLASRISYDAEAEDTTRQFFRYAPLDSLLEAR